MARTSTAFAVPANLTQAGFRTSGEGGVPHELIFEDKSGAEEVYMRSGRNYRRDVTQDEFANVQGLHEVTVQKTSRLFATKAIHIESAETIMLTVGESRIVISSKGVWIDAPMIDLNSGGKAAPVPAVSPPAKAAAAAATKARMAGGAPVGPGAGPGGTGAKTATGDPLTGLPQAALRQRPEVPVRLRRRRRRSRRRRRNWPNSSSSRADRARRRMPTWWPPNSRRCRALRSSRSPITM